MIQIDNVLKSHTPNRFFVSKGTGESETSTLNSFDAALQNAGVLNCNLVPVSSIIPQHCPKLRRVPHLPAGIILHCVLARLDGHKGDTLSAALAYGISPEHGIVAEMTSHESAQHVRKQTEARLLEMAEMRNMSLTEKAVVSTSIPKVETAFATVVVVLGLVFATADHSESDSAE